MKKRVVKMLVLAMCIAALGLTGCSQNKRPVEEPPEEVLHPDTAGTSEGIKAPEGNSTNGENGSGNAESGNTTPDSAGTENMTSYDGTVLENAISTKIGLNDSTSYSIHMYNNAASETILGYLSGSEMRFPTYTYNEETGYVAQHIRGNYNRDAETDVETIHSGELYLFSDGQLRLYFKDVENAGISATPIGYFADDISGLVEAAYAENRGDSWGVDVYFLIKKEG